MGRNRLTREEIIRYKLARKRKIRRYTGLIISFTVVAVIAAFIISQLSESRLSGGEISTGVGADIGASGTAPMEMRETATDAMAQGEADDTSSEKNTEEDTAGDTEFIVPDTSLPMVEEIEGNNWYDDSFYQVSDEKPVDMSYFDNTVFIGDSRTEGLLIYSGVSNLNGFCYKGLSVDKLTSDPNIVIDDTGFKYTCYEAIEYTKYDNYYCMFGINELGWVLSDVFIEEFSELIDHIFSVNPNAVVYVESILPVTEASSAVSDIYTQERINEYNRNLLEMCKERKDVIYLDLASAVSDENGYLPDEASVDGVHCSSDYCKRMIQYIRCNTFTRK